MVAHVRRLDLLILDYDTLERQLVLPRQNWLKSTNLLELEDALTEAIAVGLGVSIRLVQCLQFGLQRVELKLHI